MVPDVFEASDLQAIREEITQLVHEGAVKLKAEGKVSSLYEEEPFERRLTRLYNECGGEISLLSARSRLRGAEPAESRIGGHRVGGV